MIIDINKLTEEQREKIQSIYKYPQRHCWIKQLLTIQILAIRYLLEEIFDEKELKKLIK